MAELIVVLLVIVVLLAILLPLVLGHIDDTKKNAELSEARAVKVAMQTIINENYIDKDMKDFVVYVDHGNYGLSGFGKDEIKKLLNMDIGKIDNIYIDDMHILKEFSYFTVKGSKINYKDDAYVTEYIY